MSENITIDSLLQDILADPAKALRQYRDAVPMDVLRDLTGKAAHPQVQRFLAGYPETPGRVLEQLGEQSDRSDILAVLAGNPRCPRVTLLNLAAHGSGEVRVAVAANRSLSPQAAGLLAADSLVEVRLSLSGNPAITPRIQLLLVKDPVPFVRAALLRQSRLEPDVLRVLAEDDDPLIRAATLLSGKLSEEDLLAWADSDDRLSQSLLLLRDPLPDAVGESLCFSPHQAIQLAALQRRRLDPDEIYGWLRQGDVSVRRLLAARPDMPPELQELLAGDEDESLRCILAANETICPDAAAILAREQNESLWLLLARNPGCPAAALSLLCQHDHRDLRKVIADRGDLTADHMRLLLATGDEEVAYHLAVSGTALPDMDSTLAHRLCEHSLPSLRALGATCEGLFRAAFARLVHDPVDVVRCRVAANAGLPGELLDLLQVDDSESVRKAAAAELARRRAQEPAPAAVPEVGATRTPPAAGLLSRFLEKLWPGRADE